MNTKKRRTEEQPFGSSLLRVKSYGINAIFETPSVAL
jgi:hypothetical protein